MKIQNFFLIISVLIISSCSKTVIMTPKDLFFNEKPIESSKYIKLELESINTKIECRKENHRKTLLLIQNFKEAENFDQLMKYIDFIEQREHEVYEAEINQLEKFSNEEMSSDDTLYRFSYDDFDKKEGGYLVLSKNGKLKNRFVDVTVEKWPFEVAKVLDKTIKLYSNCSSYIDSGKVITEEICSKKTTKKETTFNTIFDRSNGFRFESQQKLRTDIPPFVEIIYYDNKKVKLFDHIDEYWGGNPIKEVYEFDVSPESVNYDFDSAFLKIPACLNIEKDNKGGFIHYGYAEIVEEKLNGNNAYKISFINKKKLKKKKKRKNEKKPDSIVIEPHSTEKAADSSDCNFFSDQDNLTIWIDTETYLILKIQEITNYDLQNCPETKEFINSFAEKIEEALSDEWVNLLEEIDDSEKTGELIQTKRIFMYEPFMNVEIDSKKLEFNPPSWKQDAASMTPDAE